MCLAGHMPIHICTVGTVASTTSITRIDLAGLGLCLLRHQPSCHIFREACHYCVMGHPQLPATERVILCQCTLMWLCVICLDRDGWTDQAPICTQCYWLGTLKFHIENCRCLNKIEKWSIKQRVLLQACSAIPSIIQTCPSCLFATWQVTFLIYVHECERGFYRSVVLLD